jgi:nitrogen-specific signal transduction histidine kinase
VLRPETQNKVIEMPSPAANGTGRPEESAVPEEAPAREAIVNIAVAPLVSKELEQIGRLIIFDDITERDELERQLVQADKLSSIGLLAAGVAHEVNTPLANPRRGCWIRSPSRLSAPAKSSIRC